MALIISSFSRMRYFRFDKASLVLKLCLPFFRAEATEEEECCERLNSFYSSLAEAYREALFKAASEREERITVSVLFSVVTDKYRNKYKRVFRKCKNPVIIERNIRSNAPEFFTNKCYLDVLDLGRGILLK